MSTNPLMQLLVGAYSLIDTTLIPLLFALAFLYFAWQVIRLFVRDSKLAGSSPFSNEKQKSQLMYSIAAMAIILSFWGLVHFFSAGLGVNNTPPNFDYFNLHR